MVRSVRYTMCVLALAAATTAGAISVANSPKGLSYDVHFLAADALEGRFSGSSGARVAARFVADRFAALGLEPRGTDGFLQPFEFIAGVHPGEGNRLVVALPGGELAARLEDDYRPLAFSSSGSAEGEVVFAGYGIASADLGYDDYAGLDVAGQGRPGLTRLPAGDGPARAVPPARPLPLHRLRHKVRNARERGAAAVIVVRARWRTDDRPRSIRRRPRRPGRRSPWADPTPLAEALLVSAGFALGHLQAASTGVQPRSRALPGVSARLRVPTSSRSRATAANVVGLLPGTDPALAGRGGGGRRPLRPPRPAARPRSRCDPTPSRRSTTAPTTTPPASPPCSRSLAAWPPSRRPAQRRLRGLLRRGDGPARLPPLSQPTRSARRDGRPWSTSTWSGGPRRRTRAHLGGYGTAAEWPTPRRKRQRPPSPQDHDQQGRLRRLRSLLLLLHDVPVLFLFTGAHSDYHTPDDDADRIDYKGMASVVALAPRSSAASPTHRNGRLSRRSPRSRARVRSYKVRTGVIPELRLRRTTAFKISGVAGASPAEKAGLAGGDVVVRFGEREIRNIYDYMYALGDHQPGERWSCWCSGGEETARARR